MGGYYLEIYQNIEENSCGEIKKCEASKRDENHISGIPPNMIDTKKEKK